MLCPCVHHVDTAACIESPLSSSCSRGPADGRHGFARRLRSCCTALQSTLDQEQRTVQQGPELQSGPRSSRGNPHAQGIFLSGADPALMTDPAMAIGKGSPAGTYAVYALLVPTSGKGSRAVVASFQYRVSKRTFKYQTRYRTAIAPRVSTVSPHGIVLRRGSVDEFAMWRSRCCRAKPALTA